MPEKVLKKTQELGMRKLTEGRNFSGPLTKRKVTLLKKNAKAATNNIAILFDMM